MYRTRRRALTLMSGIWSAPRPPRGGWHRNDPGDGGGDGSAGGGPAAGGANDGAGDDDKPDGPKFTGDFDADKARAAITSARDSEKKAKQAAKDSSDKLASVLKALGLGTDGKADPEDQVRQLTERATAAEQRANALAVKSAVRDAADEHKANAAELLDSRSFTDQLAKLDPAASDYGDKVAALVAKAAKDNPAKYGTAGAKGGTRSGSSDHTGGGGTRTRPAGLGAAIAARMQQ
ncbi:hypothetical protein GCM10010112_67810 [Actinoplanes lobatus]|uniref:Uncharacterized protein n=1 Tax=Actinoplanes lobatus TaxID=113568 RepID=A0A7W7HEP3_9ACTN|nr:hypothetical protein [Actinoplanes lobatus]MBB4749139.1 hypothetical protein [Actinoplanes lobatus]GGN86353.1 hypothetical protein GCM10010112_67810 [Actinoplanes lobatus]GIE42763.1 hypothetical protein Alo02nite_56610 [Actinoplanes lobatus]